MIFESALNINSRALLRNLGPILLLAVPIMLISTLIIATVLYFGINHPGFRWLAALICGALLSATDPVTVIDIFKHFKIGERLITFLEGESLFNDAIVIVLFGLLLSMAIEPTQQLAWHSPVLSFFYALLGGIITGLITGFISIPTYRWLRNNQLVFTGASLALVYLTFVAAE